MVVAVQKEMMESMNNEWQVTWDNTDLQLFSMNN